MHWRIRRFTPRVSPSVPCHSICRYGSLPFSRDENAQYFWQFKIQVWDYKFGGEFRQIDNCMVIFYIIRLHGYQNILIFLRLLTAHQRVSGNL